MNYLFHFFEILYILLSDDYSIISLIPPFNLKSFLGAILILGILPSLFEELLYRGMYLDTLKNSKVILQYLIPTIMFSLAHKGTFSAFSALILSIILFYFLKKYSSLILCTIIHFGYNLISIIISNLISLPYSPERLLYKSSNNTMFIGVLLFYGGIILLFISFIIMLIRNLKFKNSSENDLVLKLSKFEIFMFSIMMFVSLILFLLRSI